MRESTQICGGPPDDVADMGLLRRIAGLGSMTWAEATKVLINSGLTTEGARDTLIRLIYEKKLVPHGALGLPPKEKK